MPGYLTTNLKKSNGQYTCQFVVVDDSFNFYAGSVFLTLYIEGLDEKITVEVETPEGKSLPFIQAVYSNTSFFD